MITLTLYSTVGCHLCEQALDLVMPLIANHYGLVEVDISASDSLMARYGIRIPVIGRDDSLQEIGWPFTAEEFRAFLELT